MAFSFVLIYYSVKNIFVKTKFCQAIVIHRMIKTFSFVDNILWKMIRISNILAPLLSIIIFLACNDKEDSPFGDLLYQQPYSSLTDSIKKEPKRDELYFRRAVLLN